MTAILLAKRHGLFLVVCHNHERNSELILNVHEFELCVFTQFLVECGQWFVEQQYLRSLDQRASERDALSLAT